MAHMKTVSKISLDGALKTAAEDLSRVLQPRTFLCYYQSKKDGQQLAGTERLCLVQDMPMDSIRRDAPEFAILRTLSDASGNEFKIGLGLTLSDDLKFYKDVASGIHGLTNLKSLPLGEKLLSELADDKLLDEYLFNFSASRLLLSNIRRHLAEFHATKGNHFIPIAYKFFKQDNSKLMRLCLVEGSTLHELELRQVSSKEYRLDFHVKDYRIVSLGEYKENRGKKGYGVYLPVMRTFDENPPIEFATMKTFAEAKNYLLPRLAFMMEEHVGNSVVACIERIKEEINTLSKCEFMDAIYFQKVIDEKAYEHFLIYETGQSAGNLILVQKTRPAPADKFVPKQKAGKNLHFALTKMLENRLISIQENHWLEERLPEIHTFISRKVYRTIAAKKIEDRKIEYPLHEAADAIRSLSKGKPQLVYCAKGNDFNYMGHKYLALAQGTLTQMSRKNRLSQKAIYQGGETDPYSRTLHNRLALKEAAVEIEKGFEKHGYKLQEDCRFLNINDSNSRLRPTSIITYLLPIGRPGQGASGVLALHSTVDDYCFGGGMAFDVISFGDSLDSFQKRLRNFIQERTPEGQDHLLFFQGAKRYSASWGIEKALDNIEGLVFGFLPSIRDGLALILPGEDPNMSVKSGFYAYSMDRGRALVILDTTIPPAATKIGEVDRYAYQSWEIQTEMHFTKDQVDKLRRGFVLTHYKSSYLTPKLPLGTQTAGLLLKCLKQIVEYPLDIAKAAILSPDAPDAQGKLQQEAVFKKAENSELGSDFDDHLMAMNQLRADLGAEWRRAQVTGDVQKQKDIQARAEPLRELREFVWNVHRSQEHIDLEQTPGVKAIRSFMDKQGLKRLPLGIFG